MSKNRKSFIFVIKIDKVNDRVSLRISRIKINRPEFVGCPEMEGRAHKFCALSGGQKKALLKLTAKNFLVRARQIKENSIEGEDYLLEAV